MKNACPIIASFAAAFLLTACQTDPESVDVEDLAGRYETREGPHIPNGMLPECLNNLGSLSDIQLLAASPLDTGAVDPGSGVPAMQQVSGTPSNCRIVIKDLIECALGDDQTVFDPISNTAYHGWVGLARDWMDAPLSPEGKDWVSACMIQRLNFFGVSVPILLEGSQATIQPRADLQADYPFVESIAWGDLFSNMDGVTGAICAEPGIGALCPSGGGDWLKERVCAGVANCGIQFVGACSGVCTPTSMGWSCLGEPHTIRVRLQESLHQQYLGTCQ